MPEEGASAHGLSISSVITAMIQCSALGPYFIGMPIDVLLNADVQNNECAHYPAHARSHSSFSCSDIFAAAVALLELAKYQIDVSSVDVAVGCRMRRPCSCNAECPPDNVITCFISPSITLHVCLPPPHCIDCAPRSSVRGLIRCMPLLPSCQGVLAIVMQLLYSAHAFANIACMLNVVLSWRACSLHSCDHRCCCR
jgi:hypothetical protein